MIGFTPWFPHRKPLLPMAGQARMIAIRIKEERHSVHALINSGKNTAYETVRAEVNDD